VFTFSEKREGITEGSVFWEGSDETKRKPRREKKQMQEKVIIRSIERVKEGGKVLTKRQLLT